MNAIGKKALDENREIIILDLHGDIFIELHEKEVLSKKEVEDINSCSKQADKNSKFFNILVEKNDNALEIFLLSLTPWYWWIKLVIEESMKQELLNQNPSSYWENDVARSKIPPLPRVNVPRRDLLKKLREALKRLGKGQYVVLEGMSGCGKSSLAAEALHDNIFIDNFKGNVYWMSCGSEKEPDDNTILTLQVLLNEWFSDDELVNNVYSTQAPTLNTKLRKRFESSEYHEGLLVLDDVNSKKVIDALRIGCKTLVITTNSELLGIGCEKIKVREGFTEKESLQHFALCLKTKVEDLPDEAKKIHEHGKGHPMIITLLGALLGARPEDPENWKTVYQPLFEKDYGKIEKRLSYSDKQLLPNTIKFCISNLNKEMQEKYQDFALFVEDINIKPEVLAILWDESLADIHCIMDEFDKKNLIVKKFDPEKQDYVYGIHDILLYYLKKQYNDKEHEKLFEKDDKLHQKLIDRYLKASGNDLSKVPKKDDYFYIYIGYHIAHAKRFSMFKELYFNLNFIEAKLSVSLLGDLLLDYKRYKDHFVHGLDESSSSIVLKKLADFVKFVETWGHDIRNGEGPDIVQYALQEPPESAVYKAALREESIRRDITYLRLGPSDTKSASREVTITNGKVSAVGFLSENQFIIVGFETGAVQIITVKGYKKYEFEGHKNTVTRLAVSSKNLFLSVAGTSVKAWLTPDLNGAADIGNGNRTPSPIQRQEAYTDIFKDYRSSKISSFQEFDEFKQQVGWACFSPNSEKIAICSAEEKRISIYAMETKKYSLFAEIKKVPASSCIFMHGSGQLVVGCSNSDIRIYSLDSSKKVWTYQTHVFDSYPTRAIFNLSDDKFAVLNTKSLSVWETDEEVSSLSTQKIPCLRDYLKKNNETYECCAVDPKGLFMAVATSSGKILICKVSDGSLFRELSTSSGNAKYLEIGGSNEHNLIACLEDGSVKLWTIGDVLVGTPPVMSEKFDVAWTSSRSGHLESTITAPTSKGIKIVHANLTKDALSSDAFKATELYIDFPDSLSGKEIIFCSISKCSKYIITANQCQVFLIINFGKYCGKIVGVLDFTYKKDLKIHLVKFEIINETVVVAVMVEGERRKETITDVATMKEKTVMIWRCKEETVHNPRNGEVMHELGKLVDRLKDLYLISETESVIVIGSSGCIKRLTNILGNIKPPSVINPGSFDVNVNASDLSCKKILAILDGKGKQVYVYDLEKNKMLYKLDLAWEPVCCSFSPNGERLVYGCIHTNTDKSSEVKIQVLDVQTGQESSEISVHGRNVSSVCVSNTGLAVALIEDLLVVGGAVPRGQARLQASRVVMAPDTSCVVTVDACGHHHFVTWGGNGLTTHLMKPKPRRVVIANGSSTL